MTHIPIDDLSAYLDGALDPVAHATAVEHLAVCGACAQMAADLAQVAAFTRALPHVTPPSGARFHVPVSAPRPRLSWPLPMLGAGLAAAALALLAIGLASGIPMAVDLAEGFRAGTIGSVDTLTRSDSDAQPMSGQTGPPVGGDMGSGQVENAPDPDAQSVSAEIPPAPTDSARRGAALMAFAAAVALAALALFLARRRRVP